jgi:hypothetical protein
MPSSRVMIPCPKRFVVHRYVSIDNVRDVIVAIFIVAVKLILLDGNLIKSQLPQKDTGFFRRLSGGEEERETFFSLCHEYIYLSEKTVSVTPSVLLYPHNGGDLPRQATESTVSKGCNPMHTSLLRITVLHILDDDSSV